MANAKSFETEEWRYREFKIENLFTSQNGDFDIKKEHINNQGVDVVTAGDTDYGILGKSDIKAKVFSGNTITVDMFGSVKYRSDEYKMVTHARVFSLKCLYDGFNEEIGLFITTCLQKRLCAFEYSNMCSWKKIRNLSISLPILINPETNQPIIDETCQYHKDGYIPDWKYMQERIKELEQERIKELEQERIKELEQYLIVTGLNDYELTEEDKEILATKLFDGGKESHVGKEWKEAREFRVGVLFEKPKLGWKADRKFNKRNDLSTIPTPEFSLPLVNAKYGNNGIMYYGREDDFYSIENSIDIVNDGAVSAGSVYPQPDKTGVLYNAYLITLKDHTPSRKEIEYLATCLNKVIKPQFSYSNKAGWDKVQKTNVSLPIQTDSSNHPVIDPTHKYHPEGFVPDWDYMEKYIRAMEKVVIKDVVVWKDEMIKKTKMVVNSTTV